MPFMSSSRRRYNIEFYARDWPHYRKSQNVWLGTIMERETVESEYFDFICVFDDEDLTFSR